jgi:hypothetical protein
MDHLDGASESVTAAGWTLSRAMLRAPGAEAVLTAGPRNAEASAGARLGIIGAVAHAAEAGSSGAGQSAAIALAGLVDGFYNARPTLGQGQALIQALTAINRWMFAMRGAEGTQPGLSASLSAVILSGGRAGLLQIGGGVVLRLRAGELTPLTEPQRLRLPDGTMGLRRSLGTDSRVLLDYQEEAVLAGDRLILLSDLGAIDRRMLAALCRRAQPAQDLAGDLAAFPAEDGIRRAALVIDVQAVPEPTVSAAEAALTDLPLAPIPREGENRDGWLIGRTLHRGAYTLLKHAVDIRTNQPVVLKFPLPAMLNDRVFQAGFARETWVGTSIHSPVIARVIPPEPGRRSSLYIVMPYYRGETLEARITREPYVSGSEILAIALQLCRAVEDLRAIQVLHRDLKPDNVMLVAGGGLRLLDLGLAYLTGVEAAAAQGPAGTLRYMAPEVVRGAAPGDASEVYALGVVLHRLAAGGRFPRPGADVAAGLSRARPDLPDGFAVAIAAALDWEAAKRPPHAGILAEALSRAQQQAGVSRLARRRRLDPLTVWRGLAVVLGLALILALALRQ